MTHGKTYNKSPRRINHKATKSKTNTKKGKIKVQGVPQSQTAALPRPKPGTLNSTLLQMDQKWPYLAVELHD